MKKIIIIFFGVITMVYNLALAYTKDEIELIYFSGKGDLYSVQNYVEKGVKIDCKSIRDKVTPFINSVAEENFEISKFLLSKGADVNEMDYKGNTALMYAVCPAKLDISNRCKSGQGKSQSLVARMGMWWET